jgi:hypothetical protein
MPILRTWWHRGEVASALQVSERKLTAGMYHCTSSTPKVQRQHRFVSGRVTNL